MSYTADPTRPIRFAGITHPAESFTDQAVDNLTAVEPVLEVAVVVGATLTLLYDEALDETSEPATGDFAVTVAGSARGVSDVDVSGPRVVLTLASAVEEGEAVTVSYTKGTNPIRDTHANHNEAADLGRGVGGEPRGRHHGAAAAERRRAEDGDHADLRRAAGPGLHAGNRAIPRVGQPPGRRPADREQRRNTGPDGGADPAETVSEDQVATMDLTYNPGQTIAIQDLAGNRGPAISISQNRPAGVRLTWGRRRSAPPSPGSPPGGGGSAPSVGAPSADAGADLEADPRLR